nr:hypothetical protein [uncultured Desulfobacter sp.]
MNHSKTFATLSLAAATGKKIYEIVKVERDKKAMRLGRCLQLTGKYVAARYPSDSLTPSKIMSVYYSAIGLVSGPTEPTAILSMIIAGLSDISAKSDKKRKKLVDQVIKDAQACLDMYPLADIDHNAAWAQYERWAA